MCIPLMWQPPQTCFEVKPAVEQWAAAPNDTASSSQKKLFALELAKGLKPFEAALNVYPNDTGLALWVSQNWLNDPEVVQTKQTQLDQIEIKLLDKDALAAKVLRFSEEKDTTGRFYLAEDKNRLAALRLYAEICGYIGKVDIDLSTKNFNTNNEMKIVLVSPPVVVEDHSVKTIEHDDTVIDNVTPLRGVKLVG